MLLGLRSAAYFVPPYDDQPRNGGFAVGVTERGLILVGNHLGLTETRMPSPATPTALPCRITRSKSSSRP